MRCDEHLPMETSAVHCSGKGLDGREAVKKSLGNGVEVEGRQLPKYGSYSKNLVMVRNEQPGSREENEEKADAIAACGGVARRGGCNNRQIADAIYYPPPGIDSPRSFVRRPFERGIGHELVSHVVGMSRNLQRARPQHPSPLQWSNGHRGGEECSASLAGPGGAGRLSLFVVGAEFSLLL